MSISKAYKVNGLTCSSCERKVADSLKGIEGVEKVQVSKTEGRAYLTFSNEVDLEFLQGSLNPKYTIQASSTASKESWIKTYKPILLIFSYLIAITYLIEVISGSFDTIRWMRHFMGGFFLVFSFFKMLNLSGFVASYQMYDIIARKLPVWGYVYAFIELGLGICFLIHFNPIITNAITIIVMSISIVGVIQSVTSKKQLQCACLGDVFDLPMSTVTIIEDGLMILMSIVMLVLLA